MDIAAAVHNHPVSGFKNLSADFGKMGIVVIFNRPAAKIEKKAKARKCQKAKKTRPASNRS